MKSPITVLLLCMLWIPAAYSDQNSPQLGALFDTLQNESTTRSQAQVVTSEIWQQWLKTDDEEAGHLMSLGISEMNQLSLRKAAEIFTNLIELQPEFAEAWNKRATVYYMMGELDLSTSDVAETLKLEPRHFGALSGQGLIYLQLDRREAALEWFKRALEVNPFMDNIRMSVEQLEEEIKGKII
jgi:tetratricopeptide (TPR) repeat protein